MGLFGEYLQELGITDEAKQRDIESACICMMAAKADKIQGYDFEKVTNSAELQSVKSAAVEAYMKNENNPKWLGTFIFYGQRDLVDQIDKMMEGKDLTNPKVRSEVFQKIHPAVQALSDTFQYVEKHPEMMAEYIRAAQREAVAAGGTAKDGTDMANETKDCAINVSTLCELLARADSFKASPLPTEDAESMKSGLTAQMEVRWLFEEYPWDSKVPFSRSCPPAKIIRDVWKKIETEAEKAGIFDIADRLVRGGKNQEAGADYVRSRLAGETKVDIETQKKNYLVSYWEIGKDGKGEKALYSGEYMGPRKVSVNLPRKFKDMAPKQVQSPEVSTNRQDVKSCLSRK